MTTTPSLPADDEIDLRQLAAALGRRWPWILAGGLGGLLAAGVVTSMSKPVWEGEFQIVLSKRDTGGGGTLASLAASNPMLANLAGLNAGGGGSELETEVKILESPSVLKPVFDLVKTRKASSGDDGSQLRFADWVKDNLSIKLEKGTSVLTIAYRDTDKALVLPMMQQISKAYQAYSGRDRSDSLRNGVAYAQRQAARFREQAAASNKALDAFRIRYGIASSGGSIASTGIDVSKLLSAAAGNDAGSAIQVQGGSSSSTLSAQGDPLGQLAAVNQELIRRRQTFTDQDPSIQALLKERNALRHYIETTGGGNLALPGTRSLSKDEAQQILLRYQELERTAKRDTATLDSLENTLLSLQLEQARATKPWELISKPTLLEKPVSPRPARNLALGLLSGVVLGSALALVADRRSGRVFSAEELEHLLKSQPLARLQDSNSEASTTTIALLCQHQLKPQTSLALVPIGLPVDDARLINLQTQLQSHLPGGTVSRCADVLQAERYEQQLLITAPGAAGRREVAELRQQLNLQATAPLGWLLLEGRDA